MIPATIKIPLEDFFICGVGVDVDVDVGVGVGVSIFSIIYLFTG